MTKLVKISVCLMAIGLCIVSMMFVYYHFHLGVEPCKGLPSDASNCGDGDFGGVYFILGGTPFILLGIVGLIGSLIIKLFKCLPHR